MKKTKRPSARKAAGSPKKTKPIMRHGRDGVRARDGVRGKPKPKS